MKRKWKIVFGVVVLLLVGGVLITQALAGETVEVKRMEPEDIRRSFTEDGTVKPLEERTIHPSVSARIVELKVEEGDWVEEGGLVMVLDDVEIRYKLEELEAQLRQLQAESREFDWKPSYWAIKSKEIAIERVRHQMDEYRIHAPISGKVANLQAEEGGLVGPEMPIMKLFAPEDYEVETWVLTKDIYDIYEGMTVGLTLEKRGVDREFTGKVVKIAPCAEESLSSLGLKEERVKVTISPHIPEDVGIAPGYKLEVEFILEELSEQMVVPKRILFTYEGEDALFVVENGRAKVRRLTTGLETRNKVVIVEGLVEGEMVVMDHQLKDIREGSRVRASVREE